MGYNMTEWQTGDVVTEEKINNMELGIYNNDMFKAPGYVIEMLNTTPSSLVMALREGGVETLLGDLYGGANFLIHVSGNTEVFGSPSTVYLDIDPTDFSIGVQTNILLDDATYVFEKIENNSIYFRVQST